MLLKGTFDIYKRAPSIALWHYKWVKWCNILTLCPAAGMLEYACWGAAVVSNCRLVAVFDLSACCTGGDGRLPGVFDSPVDVDICCTGGDWTPPAVLGPKDSCCRGVGEGNLLTTVGWYMDICWYSVAVWPPLIDCLAAPWVCPWGWRTYKTTRKPMIKHILKVINKQK